MVFGQGHTETNTESDGEANEEDDEGAPPFETAGAAGMLDTLADLLVALLDVLDCVLGVYLGGNNHVLLLLNHGSKFLEQEGELGESLLDALELIVASTHIAKQRGSVASLVGAKLQREELGQQCLRLIHSTQTGAGKE